MHVAWSRESGQGTWVALNSKVWISFPEASALPRLPTWPRIPESGDGTPNSTFRLHVTLAHRNRTHSKFCARTHTEKCQQSCSTRSHRRVPEVANSRSKRNRGLPRVPGSCWNPTIHTARGVNAPSSTPAEGSPGSRLPHPRLGPAVPGPQPRAEGSSGPSGRGAGDGARRPAPPQASPSPASVGGCEPQRRRPAGARRPGRPRVGRRRRKQASALPPAPGRRSPPAGPPRRRRASRRRDPGTGRLPGSGRGPAAPGRSVPSTE